MSTETKTNMLMVIETQSFFNIVQWYTLELSSKESLTSYPTLFPNIPVYLTLSN